MKPPLYVGRHYGQSGDGDERVPPYIEVLRGRDGRDGRDGGLGPRGPAGRDGVNGDKGMKGDVGPAGPSSGGVTYVRWGRTTCPNTAELVYEGTVGNSLYSSNGGGSNYQCLTDEPEHYENFGPGLADVAGYMYGVEYVIYSNVPSSTTHLLHHNVPCAVCYVATHETVLMIPGRYTCLPNWTREYHGYLMTERSHEGHRRSTFQCVDFEAETTSGGQGYQSGGYFYHVEPRCGSLPCPPYEEEKEMSCVVCTR